MPTRVASVQLAFAYFNTPQEFADHVRAPIELAAQNGAQLILLPHFTSLMLFGMFDFDAKPAEPLGALSARQNITTQEWLNERAGYVFEFYLHLFQSLALRVETWLAPGTVVEQENKAAYVTAFLLNPEGEIVGRQRKIHLTAEENEWGIAQGDTLRVFETEIGNFGFVIGDDVHDPETARALVENGAEVLLHPTASLSSDASSLRSLLTAVESNQTFGIQANLTGGDFRGQSAIYAPAEITADKRGILAQATGAAEGELILADLDFDVLNRIRTDASTRDETIRRVGKETIDNARRSHS